MRLLRHLRDHDLAPLLSVLLVCAFPCVFIYARNAEEAAPSGMVPFLLVFLATALLITLVALPFFRNFSRAAFFTDAAMLVVINFSLVADRLEAWFPWLWSRYTLLLFAALLAALFLLLLLKKPDLRIGCTLVAIAFAAITLMNLALAAPDILHAMQVEKPEVEPDTQTGIVFDRQDVNVYYFIFDEYGGYESLLRYYDYDNSPFLDALADRGFTVTRECRNPESVYTAAICPNLLNLDYVVDFDTYGILTDYYMDNSYLVRMFSQNGYQVNLVNQDDFIGSTGCNVLTSGQTKDSLSQYLLDNSLFKKITPVRTFLARTLRFTEDDQIYDSLENALEAGLRCSSYAQDGPTLTLGYLCLPHSPLVIGRNGEHYRPKDKYNWRDQDLYLGQLEYTSAYILQLVDTIQADDPDALIILQSDHGCRYPMHLIQVKASDWYEPEEENPYMQNILNCVCYGGQRFDIEGSTGINTLRSVFNQVLGTDFESIDPVYDYFNYSPYIGSGKLR